MFHCHSLTERPVLRVGVESEQIVNSEQNVHPPHDKTQGICKGCCESDKLGWSNSSFNLVKPEGESQHQKQASCIPGIVRSCFCNTDTGRQQQLYYYAKPLKDTMKGADLLPYARMLSLASRSPISNCTKALAALKMHRTAKADTQLCLRASGTTALSSGSAGGLSALVKPSSMLVPMAAATNIPLQEIQPVRKELISFPLLIG